MNIKTETPLIPAREDDTGRVVTIFLSAYMSGEIRNFRCMNCGKLLFKYESDLTLIIDSSDAPKETPATEHLCTRCGIIYRVLL